MPTKELDLGIVAEGVVELDPMTGRMVVRVIGDDGSNEYIDVQANLEKYLGKEVRFIVTPQESISQLAEMVDKGEITLDQVPVLRPQGTSS
jgi:hypothetical protein